VQTLNRARRIATVLACSIAFCCSLPCSAQWKQQKAPAQGRTGRLESGPKAVLEQKLKTIVIPRFSAEDVAAQDVLAALAEQARKLDPEKRGVNIFYKCDQRNLLQKLTVDFKDLPLADALLYTCKTCGMDYVVEEHAVVIFTKTGE